MIHDIYSSKYSFKSMKFLDKQNKALKALVNAIEGGVHETQGELEARKVELEEELLKSRKILSDFKVHERYKDIQVEANRLTGELHQLANQNVSDARKLDHYSNAIADETPPDQMKLEAIYDETGLVFPVSIKRTLEGTVANFSYRYDWFISLFVEVES